MSKGQSLQDPFLNTLRKERVPVSIFLVNGIKLQEYGPMIDPMMRQRKERVALAEREAGARYVDAAAAEAGAQRTDSGAVYRVLSGAPKDAAWTSAPLDAAFLSKWGRLDWRGTGSFTLSPTKVGDAPM